MKKVISLVLVFSIIVGLFSVSTVVGHAYDDKKYATIFADYCKENGYNFSLELISSDMMMCETKIEYFAEDNTSDVPDLVIVNFGDLGMPMLARGVFGDYALLNIWVAPYSLGYYVYLPKEDKIYEIGEAWDLEVEYLTEALDQIIKSDEHKFYLIGDADADGSLSVIDATYIQLALAGVNDFRQNDDLKDTVMMYIGDSTVGYISDFDRDGERTVLDATAIQYKLAGLEFIPDTNE